ncbi:MAG: ribosome hibernation-promoting factor, HPF/YfiA family [Desulfovibrio sp.]
MNISFNFKNFDPSPHLKEYAQTRFEKIGKYTGDSEAELQVNLSVEKIRHMADVILNADNIHVSAYEASEDMYSTIDMVLDKVTAQLRRMNDKARARRRDGTPVSMDVITLSEEPSNAPTIVESDNFVAKPMAVEEAAMQLETFDNYHFLVFRNADTDRVNVIYRQKKDVYGLIDPGF